jgi:hypothetical protein
MDFSDHQIWWGFINQRRCVITFGIENNAWNSRNKSRNLKYDGELFNPQLCTDLDS